MPCTPRRKLPEALDFRKCQHDLFAMPLSIALLRCANKLCSRPERERVMHRLPLVVTWIEFRKPLCASVLVSASTDRNTCVSPKPTPAHQIPQTPNRPC